MLINLKLLTIANYFLLNIAKHEIFSANKYENARYCFITRRPANLRVYVFGYKSRCQRQKQEMELIKAFNWIETLYKIKLKIQ